MRALCLRVTRTYLINIPARTNAVILECLCRESRKSHGRGFPTEAFGNDGLVGLWSIYEMRSSHPNFSTLRLKIPRFRESDELPRAWLWIALTAQDAPGRT